MADVTIRGAGIFGLSVAWVCVQRGARVQVVDPYGPGVGASGGIVGALAPHVPENWNDKKAFQFDSLMMAERFWSDVAAASGHDPGYGRTGRLQPIADARALELARDREESARRLWQGLAHWQVIDAAQAGAWAPHSATEFLIRDTLTARLHPRRACAALSAALADQDVPILPDAQRSGAVIWAAGVRGLAEISKGRDRPVGNGVKGQAALLRPTKALPPTAPQLFADGLHIIPHADGTVAVGSTSERDYADPVSTDTKLDDLIDRVRHHVPTLNNAEVIERWAGERPRARSRAPMLGAWPGRPGHFVANGGFKIGFGMAPKVAHAIADLVLEGHDVIPDAFRVEASI